MNLKILLRRLSLALAVAMLSVSFSACVPPTGKTEVKQNKVAETFVRCGIFLASCGMAITSGVLFTDVITRPRPTVTNSELAFYGEGTAESARSMLNFKVEPHDREKKPNEMVLNRNENGDVELASRDGSFSKGFELDGSFKMLDGTLLKPKVIESETMTNDGSVYDNSYVVWEKENGEVVLQMNLFFEKQGEPIGVPSKLTTADSVTAYLFAGERDENDELQILGTVEMDLEIDSAGRLDAVRVEADKLTSGFESYYNHQGRTVGAELLIASGLLAAGAIGALVAFDWPED